MSSPSISRPSNGDKDSALPRPVTLTSFTIFTKLPLELRTLIWRASLMPRIVGVEITEDDTGFASRASDPPALRTCQESRSAVIHLYPLCFGSIFYPARTRFNFSLDTLFLNPKEHEELPHLFSTMRHEVSQLRYIALESTLTDSAYMAEGEFAYHLKHAVEKLSGLRELIIVFDVANLTQWEIDCGEDYHRMKLFDDLPEELRSPTLGVAPLPSVKEMEIRGICTWNVAVCRPVYGWARCPSGVEAIKSGNLQAFQDMLDAKDLHTLWEDTDSEYMTEDDSDL